MQNNILMKFVLILKAFLIENRLIEEVRVPKVGIDLRIG